MKWCEHIEEHGNGLRLTCKTNTGNPHNEGRIFVNVIDEDKFCPICGTPRPIEKSFRERLSDLLRGCLPA